MQSLYVKGVAFTLKNKHQINGKRIIFDKVNFFEEKVDIQNRIK